MASQAGSGQGWKAFGNTLVTGGLDVGLRIAGSIAGFNAQLTAVGASAILNGGKFTLNGVQNSLLSTLPSTYAFDRLNSSGALTSGQEEIQDFGYTPEILVTADRNRTSQTLVYNTGYNFANSGLNYFGDPVQNSSHSNFTANNFFNGFSMGFVNSYLLMGFGGNMVPSFQQPFYSAGVTVGNTLGLVSGIRGLFKGLSYLATRGLRTEVQAVEGIYEFTAASARHMLGNLRI